jgi:predicted lipid-binding transport protein (Tim44 family)
VDAGDVRFPAWLPENGAASAVAPTLDKDQASDLFFRVQGAWTRRDLVPVLSILGPELERALNDDLQDLLRKGELNRLENISVRSVETLSSWSEGSTHFATVRFVANLLDYTVDEKTGRVVAGSDTEPVKFQEDWTFSRSPSDANWRVSAIEQVN